MRDTIVKLKRRSRSKVGRRHVTWHYFQVCVEGDFGETNEVTIRVALAGGSRMHAEMVGRPPIK